METLALSALVEHGEFVVSTSSRDLAARLSIGKDSAARAIRRLRAERLIVLNPTSRAVSARFVANTYTICIANAAGVTETRRGDQSHRAAKQRRSSNMSGRLFEVDE